MDKWLAIVLLPIVVWALILGWLIYATRGNRAIKLNVRGIGMSIVVETTAPSASEHHNNAE